METVFLTFNTLAVPVQAALRFPLELRQQEKVLTTYWCSGARHVL